MFEFKNNYSKLKGDEIKITDKAIFEIKKFHNVMFKEIENMRSGVNEVAHTFLPRYIDHLVKIAVHNALLQDRTEVYPIDVQYASRMLVDVLKNIFVYLEKLYGLGKLKESKLEENLIVKRYLKLYEFYLRLKKEKGVVYIADLVNCFRNYYNISRVYSYELIRKFVKLGWIVRTQGKNSKVILFNFPPTYDAWKKRIEESVGYYEENKSSSG